MIDVRLAQRLFASAIAIVAGAGAVAAAGGGPDLPASAETAAAVDPAASAPSAAKRIYASALPRLLQFRTLVGGGEPPSSTGSGFLVTADGLAVTNYHVVSQVALEPNIYRLQYIGADGNRGDAALLAVDVANDLAVVRVGRHDAPFFAFDPTAIAGGLSRGERLYSMGNPLDLGFTINDGIYNGPVERSYTERLHFAGALNPGMSGGPAVTSDGLVAGVNVAKRTGGAELVSFLVPARFAAALLQRVPKDPMPPQDFRAEIGRQLKAWQASLYRALADGGFRAVEFGPYRAPEAGVPWFTCSAQTNAGTVPKPRTSINSMNCHSDTGLFIAGDLMTGTIQLAHSFVATADLNSFRFAAALSRQSQTPMPGDIRLLRRPKWHTTQHCHEDFVAAAVGRNHPPLRVAWCAQAYRDFDGLYDVTLTAVTEDHDTEALVSRLSLQATGYDEAVMLGKRFLEAVQK